MKREFLILSIFIAVFLMSGAGCQKEVEDINSVSESEKSPENSNELGTKEVRDSKVLVDRTRFVQGGQKPFDFTTIIFTQKADKGYKAELNSDKSFKAEVMTDKDCLLKSQEQDYKSLSTKEGRSITIINEDTLKEDRTLCVGATALEEGQIEIKFKVSELTF